MNSPPDSPRLRSQWQTEYPHSSGELIRILSNKLRRYAVSERVIGEFADEAFDEFSLHLLMESEWAGDIAYWKSLNISYDEETKINRWHDTYMFA